MPWVGRCSSASAASFVRRGDAGRSPRQGRPLPALRRQDGACAMSPSISKPRASRRRRAPRLGRLMPTSRSMRCVRGRVGRVRPCGTSAATTTLESSPPQSSSTMRVASSRPGKVNPGPPPARNGSGASELILRSRPVSASSPVLSRRFEERRRWSPPFTPDASPPMIPRCSPPPSRRKFSTWPGAKR